MPPLHPALTRRLIQDVADVTEDTADDWESSMTRIEDEIIQQNLSVDLDDLAPHLQNAGHGKEYYDKLDGYLETDTGIEEIVSPVLIEGVDGLAKRQEHVQGMIDMKSRQAQEEIEAITEFLTRNALKVSRATSDPRFSQLFNAATEERLKELSTKCSEILEKFKPVKDEILKTVREECNVEELSRKYKTYSDLARVKVAKAERESAADKQKLTEVEEKLADEKRVVQERDASIEDLQKQLESTNMELQSERRLVQVRDSSIENLQRQLQSANTEIQSRRRLVQQRDAFIDELQKQTQSDKAAYQSLRSQFDLERQTCSSTTQQLSKTDERLTEVRESVQDLRYTVQLQRGIIKDNEKRIDSQAEELRVAKEKIRSLTEANNQRIRGYGTGRGQGDFGYDPIEEESFEGFAGSTVEDDPRQPGVIPTATATPPPGKRQRPLTSSSKGLSPQKQPPKKARQAADLSTSPSLEPEPEPEPTRSTRARMSSLASSILHPSGSRRSLIPFRSSSRRSPIPTFFQGSQEAAAAATAGASQAREGELLLGQEDEGEESGAPAGVSSAARLSSAAGPSTVAGPSTAALDIPVKIRDIWNQMNLPASLTNDDLLYLRGAMESAQKKKNTASRPPYLLSECANKASIGTELCFTSRLRGVNSADFDYRGDNQGNKAACLKCRGKFPCFQVRWVDNAAMADETLPKRWDVVKRVDV